MEENISEELVREYFSGQNDRIYGEQYESLFPDIEPPPELIATLDNLDVGDCIYPSDEFIYMAMESYSMMSSVIQGARYMPPKIIDIAEHIRMQYVEEIEYLEEDGTLEEGFSVDFLGYEEAMLDTRSIDSRVCDVLNVLGLTYLEDELVSYYSFKTDKVETTYVYNRIMNSSTINLFDFDFKNILIDRNNERYEESIRKGYNNLLRISVGVI